MVQLFDLTAGYGDREILHGLNLEFRPGELTAVIGPNGCGKSTLLRAIAGQVPSGGKTILSGMDASALSHTGRARQVAYLPQSRPVPEMTVGQLVLHGRFPYLSYPRRYRREDLAAAEQAMEAMGIRHLREEFLSTLSGGTRQKCYIAMALAQDSPVILMDEPTAGLDMSRRLDLLEQCRALAHRGKTMVLVLHELELALRFADRLILMEEGTVTAEGTPEEILSTGEAERVFDLSVETIHTPAGPRYYFEKRT